MKQSTEEEAQKLICAKYEAALWLTLPDEIIGVAENLNLEATILNGLRHNPTKGTAGWYLWAGEELSADPDFFKPIHMMHLRDRRPDIIQYLGLGPGWRFLVVPNEDHIDVWHDKTIAHD